MKRTFIVSAPDEWGGVSHYAIGASHCSVSAEGWLRLDKGRTLMAAFAPGYWLSFKEL